jgi:hypothetical protein
MTDPLLRGIYSGMEYDRYQQCYTSHMTCTIKTYSKGYDDCYTLTAAKPPKIVPNIRAVALSDIGVQLMMLKCL